VNSLASRLTLWYAGIFILFTGSAFLLFYFSINTILDQRIDEDLEEDIVEMRSLYNDAGIAGIKAEIQREVAQDNTDEIFLRLLNSNGIELFASDMSHWRSLVSDLAAPGSLTTTSDSRLETVLIEDDDYPTRIVTGLLAPDLALQIGESTEDKEEFMELLLGIFTTTLLFVTFFAALVGWFMARKALRGIGEVTLAAEDVANGTLDRHVTVKAQGEEIDRLVNTFNIMVDRIRTLVAGMREITDNIAHDLRSAVARIRASAELTLSSDASTSEYRTSAADIIEECDRMMEMINTTLDVAEAEAGTAILSDKDVDLTTLIQDASELFEPVAEDKHIQLTVSTINDCHTRGNTQQLQRMLANLLDNAVKYTSAGGRIDTRMSLRDDLITIAVSDNGIGISASSQARIFDRSFRGDESRSQTGFGLGLSLARAIARSHGGDITVTSIPDEGSTFTVTLPNSH
jgi:signal transduction histidine kinase